MPNRIIRESICTSDTINELSFFEEVVCYRLWVNADDYGRFDGRPEILKGRLFPLKSGVSARQIETAIRRLSDVGTLSVYNVHGRPYIQIANWDKYQRVRNSVAKYPSPDERDQDIDSSPQLAATRRNSPPESESRIQNPESKLSADADKNLKTKHKYGEYNNVTLTADEYSKLQAEFPDVDARIDRLSEYIASKGDKYKSHYATIRSWARKDAEKAASEKKDSSFDTDEFFASSVNNAKRMAEELRAKFREDKYGS